MILAALTTSRTRWPSRYCGVDAQAGGARLGRFDGPLVVEMDVGDDRHGARGDDLRQRRGRLSSGQETRTMSAPAAAIWRTCSIVAAASAVNVLVIDCTEIGESPPTGTDPTMILRDLRRRMSR